MKKNILVSLVFLIAGHAFAQQFEDQSVKQQLSADQISEKIKLSEESLKRYRLDKAIFQDERKSNYKAILNSTDYKKCIEQNVTISCLMTGGALSMRMIEHSSEFPTVFWEKVSPKGIPEQYREKYEKIIAANNLLLTGSLSYGQYENLQEKINKCEPNMDNKFLDAEINKRKLSNKTKYRLSSSLGPLVILLCDDKGNVTNTFKEVDSKFIYSLSKQVENFIKGMDQVLIEYDRQYPEIR